MLEKLLRPHESGSVTLLTREETDGKLLAYKNEITQLRGQVDGLKQELKTVTHSCEYNILSFQTPILSWVL